MEEQVHISVKKKHAVATVALCGAAVIAAVGLSINLIKINTELKHTKAENDAYSAEISNLQTKASEIEAKLGELSAAKEELYEKLEELDSTSSYNNTEQQSDGPMTRSAVAPPETTNDTSVSAIVEKFELLEATVNQEATAYIGVEAQVVETLAYMESIPEGQPINGEFSSGYGYRTDPITGRQSLHTGLDLRAPKGTPIFATASGTVIVSKYHPTYGNMIEIDHGNGYTTVFAHCSSLMYKVGDTVKKGDQIALSGATGRVTGEHLHYEVKLYGQFQDPMNYMELN